MITPMQIKHETEELKNILSNGEMEIPSIWECVWPGLCFMVWFIFCGFLNAFIFSWRNIVDNLAVGFVVGLMVLLSSYSARSLFLSVPKAFRNKSILYSFLSRKINIYVLSGIVLSFCMTLLSGVMRLSLPMIFIACGTLFAMFMVLDFGRFQLAAFSNVISAFKDSKNA
ncbi:conjugal transfer protein TraS (plasmid) [Edwardsiella tarda]